MRLIAWRPKLLSLCLIVMLLNTTLTIVPSDPKFHQTGSTALELLDGWCYALKIESHGIPLVWSRHQCSLSEHDLKILMIWQWIGIVVSVCLSSYLLLELVPYSGPAWQWLLLLILSHKLVADLQSQRERWLNLLHTEAALVLESQQLMTLARITKSTQNTELPEEALATFQNDKQAPESQNVADLPPASEVALVALPNDKQAPESQNVADLSPGEEMVNQLAKLVIDLPTGTNLGMLHFLWMMVSGHLLASRGALFPGLQAVGLEKEAVRRCFTCFGG